MDYICKKPYAVLFDLDGLMLDTERVWLEGILRIAAGAGWQLDRELVKKTIGINCRSAALIMKEAFGADFPYWELREKFLAEEKIEFETNGIPQKRGLINLLNTLDAKKIPAAIATSTDRARAEWKLHFGGLEGRYDALVCGDEIEHGKPAPDIFELAAKKLGQKPQNCIGLEDSPAGLRALAAAGIRSIFIKDLVEPEPEVLALVWKRCDSLDEAAAFFRESLCASD
ncbi:MAG: HAD family phosphatase [Spirochaetaceae bacterium]|jgi:HAD superfamily hydrolase (TIGR01509 family)|nr:HAD family phosphatase [Spirochaetaceae bacterium]